MKEARFCRHKMVNGSSRFYWGGVRIPYRFARWWFDGAEEA
jgi:hypothetical protein